MLRFTNTATSPWIVIHANDQRRARLEAIRGVLITDYDGKDARAVGEPDEKIIGTGPKCFETAP